MVDAYWKLINVGRHAIQQVSNNMVDAYLKLINNGRHAIQQVSNNMVDAYWKLINIGRQAIQQANWKCNPECQTIWIEDQTPRLVGHLR